MATPTSSYISIETKISKDNWVTLKAIIARKKKELSELRYGDVDESLWLMDQIEYLKKMYEYHSPRFA